MCIMRRTAIGVGAAGIVLTICFTVASPRAKTTSMIWRSRRLNLEGSGIMVVGSRVTFVTQAESECNQKRYLFNAPRSSLAQRRREGRREGGIFGKVLRGFTLVGCFENRSLECLRPKVKLRPG